MKRDLSPTPDQRAGRKEKGKEKRKKKQQVSRDPTEGGRAQENNATRYSQPRAGRLTLGHAGPGTKPQRQHS
jgi:hypothetical protein